MIAAAAYALAGSGERGARILQPFDRGREVIAQAIHLAPELPAGAEAVGRTLMTRPLEVDNIG